MRESLDEAFRRVQIGDPGAFAAWYRGVALPLRRSLRGFARAVDVEAVLQESLLRMWKLAPTLNLKGENASLRYVLVLAQRLALHEARRLGRVTPLEIEALERLPEGQVAPDPPPDEPLRRAIHDCLERLPRQPRAALRARIDSQGARRDPELAAGVGMKLNTFLQNIVRARRLMKECLEGRGISLAGLVS